MTMSGISLPPRILLLHKQKTSGRLRYLRLPTGMLCFEPLPEGSTLFSGETPHAAAIHPAGFLRQAEEKLGLPPDSIEAAPEFHCWASGPEGDIPILLGAFCSIDPPFAAAESLGGRFINITEARGVAPVELELMRRAYEHVLG
jgi:hypothetical protein